MNNSETLALAKAVATKAAKAASSDLSAGTHEVDFLVRIHGTFKKGDDYPCKFVQTAKPWAILALALSKLNGVTIEALVAEQLAQTEIETKDIEARAKVALEKIKIPTEGTANGKVTSVKLVVEQLNVSDAAAGSEEVA